MADTALQTTVYAVTDTDIYSKEMLNELQRRVRIVKTALNSVEKSMEKVAFNLYWIYANKAYKAMGCESITDYAFQKFDFQKTTTYSFINIVERFAVRNEDGSVGESFDTKYKDYSSSKLSVLVNLTDEQIEESGITPDMSVRDIKKLVRKINDDDISVSSENAVTGRTAVTDTESAGPDTQYSVVVKDNELSLPVSDSGNTDNTDDEEYDDEGISGYAADTVYEFSIQDDERIVIKELKAILKKNRKEHEDSSFSLILRYPVRKD